MSRRVTVPVDHVDVILPAQTADELMSLLRQLRRRASLNEEKAAELKAEASVCGDVMLALLEAKES